jgi:N-acetylneuraminic acid mutarotase
VTKFKFRWRMPRGARCLALRSGAVLPAIVLIALMLASPSRGDELMQWTKLSPLPDAEGFAGMAVGVSDGKLIAAGGANFPAGYPWQGGKKAWYDEIFVLDGLESHWRRAAEKLPRPLAYAVSATFDDWLIIAGGESGPDDDARNGASAVPGYRANVIRVRIRDAKLEFEELPSLPQAAAHQCGVMIGSKLYVAGGSFSPKATRALDCFWVLDLAEPRDKMRWIELPTWPGPPRMQAVAAVHAGAFYLFGGVELVPGSDGNPRRDEPYLIDAYRFTPSGTGGVWKRIADLPREAAAAASPAITNDGSNLILIGGTSAAAQHIAPEDHPGWPRDALVYHVEPDHWHVVDNVVPRGSSRVTVPTTRWKGKHIIVSGERSPGRRSPGVFAVDTVVRPGESMTLSDNTSESSGYDSILAAGFALFAGSSLVVWFGFRRRRNSA